MKNEIEIKIELSKEEFLKLAPDAVPVHFERTYGFFKEDFTNISEGIFPRIKHILGDHEEIVFTIKLKKKENFNFFEREEFEVRLAPQEDIQDLRNIVKSLGYSKEIIFEKKRKNLIMGKITISFDELPFGFFVEFEGEPTEIERSLQAFGLDHRPRITKAYLALWDEIQMKYKKKEEHCIFKDSPTEER